MITTLFVGGACLLVLLAIVVGIVDAARASTWRRVAIERREQWEARRPEYHGGGHETVDDD